MWLYVCTVWGVSVRIGRDRRGRGRRSRWALVVMKLWVIVWAWGRLLLLWGGGTGGPDPSSSSVGPVVVLVVVAVS